MNLSKQKSIKRLDRSGDIRSHDLSMDLSFGNFKEKLQQKDNYLNLSQNIDFSKMKLPWTKNLNDTLNLSII